MAAEQVGVKAELAQLLGAAAGRADLGHEALFEAALGANEGQSTASEALAVRTGMHTGRSAKDKFIVADAETESEIWWEANKRLSPENFATLAEDMTSFAKGKKLYVQHLYAGADPACRIKVRVFTQFAWHSLFIRNLLIVPPKEELENFTPELTILCLPEFAADTARHQTRSETVVALNFSAGITLIGGTSYAGEMKKSVFTWLNYHLPKKGVMPMHCSVNQGADGNSAIFFGLSGTGKTTLSADPARRLVGDDEHGWSETSLFNFEGGCYAKLINLSKEAEPQIYAAVNQFGAVMENVVLTPDGKPDFADGSLTENTRGAYPLDFVSGVLPGGQSEGHPSHLIMLTADAFGVLPPVARLDPAQAMYHFLSGYTAKIPGTEKGVTEPEAVFSACFGAPFMPRPPAVYGRLLKEKIRTHKVQCWLVNTGWTGGAYGTGHRMPIGATRALLAAILDGRLANAPMRQDPFFGLAVPQSAPDCDNSLLDPRGAWADKAAYDATARKLQKMFSDNFRIFEADADADVLAAAPAVAAE